MPHLAITSIWTYAWSVITLYVVLGVIWYLLDRSVGTWLFRKWYNRTRKPSMPADKECGFLYNRSTKRQYTVGLVIATVQSVYMAWELGWGVSFLGELIVWGVEPFAMLFGFKLGRFLYDKVLRRERRDRIFDTADELSDKLSTVSVEDITGRVKRAGSFISGVGSLFHKRSVTPLPVTPVEAKPEPAPTPKQDPLDVIRRFNEGRKS